MTNPFQRNFNKRDDFSETMEGEGNRMTYSKCYKKTTVSQVLNVT